MTNNQIGQINTSKPLINCPRNLHNSSFPKLILYGQILLTLGRKKREAKDFSEFKRCKSIFSGIRKYCSWLLVVSILFEETSIYFVNIAFCYFLSHKLYMYCVNAYLFITNVIVWVRAYINNIYLCLCFTDILCKLCLYYDDM